MAKKKKVRVLWRRRHSVPGPCEVFAHLWLEPGFGKRWELWGSSGKRARVHLSSGTNEECLGRALGAVMTKLSKGDLEAVKGTYEVLAWRACVSCPEVYSGPLQCPACGEPGEPLPAGGENGRGADL